MLGAVSRLGIAIVVLLLAGASILVLSRSDSPNEEGDRKSARKIDPADRGAEAKSDRDPKAAGSSIPATKQIRTILAAALSDAPKFEELEDLTRSLTDAELQELIAEIGFFGEQGLTGWVRSALFAEWGRRDPIAALNSLRSRSVPKGTQNSTEQALFAIYRGWAENDPAAAVARLKKGTLPGEIDGQLTRVLSGQWTGYAYTEVFKQFAAQDESAAWEALPPRPAALRGFFGGMRNERQLRSYVDRWIGNWNSEEGIKAHEKYAAQLRSPLSGAIMVPTDETIARSAALSLARFDLKAAEEWLREAGPGDEQSRIQRRSELLSDWAAANPEQAQELIGMEGYHQPTIARGIIQGDPSRAVELMEAMDDHGERARSLLTAVSSLGNTHVRDFFPIPGERNRLPNFEERYQQMLDAVEAGRFKEGQEQVLLRAVHRSFQHNVAAASKALNESHRAAPNPSPLPN